MLELFPEGVRGGRRRPFSSSPTPTSARGAASAASRSTTSGQAGRTAGARSTRPVRRAALGRAAVGGAAGRRDGDRDRPWSRVRHRRAPDDAALARAAPRAGARESLLDVGCGSGVLAIAAAKLGFAPVARARPRRGRGVEATRRERRRERRRVEARARRRASARSCRRVDSRSRTSRSTSSRRCCRGSTPGARHVRLPRPRSSPTPAGWRARRPPRARRLGGRSARARE